MPFFIRWDDHDPTIIRSDISGRWTWDEYNAASEKILDMARSVEHRVDLITVYGDDAIFPKGTVSSHIMRMRHQKPKNFILTVVVNADSFLEMIIRVMNKAGMRAKPSLTTQTVDEARQLIKQDRMQSTLSDDSFY